MSLIACSNAGLMLSDLDSVLVSVTLPLESTVLVVVELKKNAFSFCVGCLGQLVAGFCMASVFFFFLNNIISIPYILLLVVIL